MSQLQLLDPSDYPVDDLVVRTIAPNGRESTYRTFDGSQVTPERAVEIAQWYAWATCTPVARVEVRTSHSLYAPPILIVEG